MALADDLRAARDLLDPELRVSPLGAVRDAVDDDERRLECLAALKAELPPPHRFVMHWFNFRYPAPIAVYALFDRAIATAESQE